MLNFLETDDAILSNYLVENFMGFLRLVWQPWQICTTGHLMRLLLYTGSRIFLADAPWSNETPLWMHQSDHICTGLHCWRFPMHL